MREKGEILVVSGLPRSGTSMMMRMLAEGGVPPFTDGKREADADNPNGYFEFEGVKSIDSDAGWLDSAEGHAVKIVSPLLPKLPESRRYRVIFLRRPLEEILESQKRMLERSGRTVEERDQRDLRRYYASHLNRIVGWLAAAEHIEVLFVHYHDVIADPETVASAVWRFVGGELDTRAMASVVNPELDRNRAVRSVQSGA